MKRFAFRGKEFEFQCVFFRIPAIYLHIPVSPFSINLRIVAEHIAFNAIIVPGSITVSETIERENLEIQVKDSGGLHLRRMDFKQIAVHLPFVYDLSGNLYIKSLLECKHIGRIITDFTEITFDFVAGKNRARKQEEQNRRDKLAFSHMSSLLYFHTFA